MCKQFDLGEPRHLAEPLGTSGWRKHFADRHVGGWIMRHIAKGDILVASKINRLGRGMIDIVNTINTLIDRGVRIFVCELGGTPLDMDTMVGRTIVHVFALLAQVQRDIIAETTRECMAWRRDNGLPTNGKGFCRIFSGPKGKRRTEWDYDQLGAVLLCAEMQHAGESWERIYQECERRGFKDAKGREWWRWNFEPGTDMDYQRRNRYKALQSAVRWLWRQAQLHALPPRIEANLWRLGRPRGIAMEKRKRRRRALVTR
jgi:hypothetical protein